MPVEVASIPIAFLSGGNPVDGLTSVAVKNGRAVVAWPPIRQEILGYVAVLDTNGNVLFSVTVGALPDMVAALRPMATKFLVANEGEPGDSDPDGSIGIVDLADDGLSATATTAGFTSFNGMEDMLRRVYACSPARACSGRGAGNTSPSLQTATRHSRPSKRPIFSQLRDIASSTVTKYRSTRFRDHNLPGNGLDPSDEDGGINIANWPVFGLYMPDAIAAYAVDGQTYLATANEAAMPAMKTSVSVT
ncbi:MAG: hypothetical protein R3F37_13715 [Candidatus Competibacteraceae bacterium]